MNLQEQYFRKILDAQRYPVNPEHERTFKALLLKEKRRRRGMLFVFLLFGAALTTWLTTDLVQHSSEPRSNMPGVTPSAAVPSSSMAMQNIRETADTRETITTDDGGTSSVAQDRAQIAVYPEVDSQIQGSGTPAHTAATPDLSTREAHAVEHISTHHTGRQPASKADLVNSAQNVTDTGVQTPSKDIVAHIESTADVAEGLLPQGESEAAASNETPPIIPAVRQEMARRFHYGVTGMWSPEGLTVSHANVSTGNAIQLGGYLTYRISPRLISRTDAGFGLLDGGFTFVKQSESQVFGFSLLTRQNSLTMKRLYSGYLSTEIGWTAGKYLLCAGLQGQYLYGARGDIRREELTLDAPSTRVFESRNVWVSKADVNSFSLHPFVAVRTKLTKRIELAGMVRFPLLGTVRLAADAGDYQFNIKSPGITPSLGLSYQINQQ